MKSIGLLSDTHSFLHPKLFEFFQDCGEIWHAGDIGKLDTAEKLNQFKPLTAVFGNIDGREIRNLYPQTLVFTCEKVKVLMMHIGGYPGHYDHQAVNLIREEKPKLFICGHSHILRVMYDKKYGMLVINPGAAGNYGDHRSLTMVRFIIEGEQIRDLEVLDIPR
ncbi:MAG: metallophosphoesterase family protein [Bacteroidetes bacterium]|nr:metallophosphoesterase family protein [Bacteroidota bacterium]